MPRAQAPIFAHAPESALRLGNRVGRPGTPRGAAWLSLLAVVASSVSAACSLSSEGTGRTERTAPSTPTDELDADLAAPEGQREAGLDGRVPTSDGSLDAHAPNRLDGAADAGARPGDAAVRDADTPDADEPDAGQVVDPGPDAASNDASARDAGVLDTGVPDAAAECAVPGAYGLRIDFQVAWKGTALEGVIPVIAPGAGVLSMFASLDLRPGAGRTQGEAQLAPCGTVIPDFAAGNNIYKGELYSVYIPEPAWESPQMPRWNLGWTAACEQPGCAFSGTNLLALLGARTVPPTPPATESALELADHDGDGLPSVTLLTRGPSALAPSGKAYSHPPLIAPWARARKMMLAIGVSGKIDGAFGACGTISGAIKQPVIEQGAVGCTGVVDANGNGNGTEQNCAENFVTFLDDNMPQWTVSSASFRAQRLPNLACTTVRSALQ